MTSANVDFLVFSDNAPIIVKTRGGGGGVGEEEEGSAGKGWGFDKF